MKLTYRGVSYESSPQAIKTIESTIFAQYRGLNYSIRRPIELPKPHQLNLKYRGVPYSKDLSQKITQSGNESGAVISAW